MVVFRGKRELLARGLLWSGATPLFERFPPRDLLLVLNYHRIGHNDNDESFDSELFSATGEELDEQISYLKRYTSVITLDEALAWIYGKSGGKSTGCKVLITFDDGYLDNYQVAFPILRAHGIQGVFFLATGMVGSTCIPWWDYISYVMKTAEERRFSLHYPSELSVDVDKNGLLASLREILSLYVSPHNTDGARFIRELQEQAKGQFPSGTVRRFLDWNEAREMARGGMVFGSHTNSHHVLSQLGLDEQRQELAYSRALFKAKLDCDAAALAYPVGQTTSFSCQTQQLAEEAGYDVAFSFYGGTNLPGETHPYDVKRVAVGEQSWARFRARTGICRVAGAYWP